MAKFKPKFYIVYPRSMNDNLKWPEGWHQSISNLPTMLQNVTDINVIGAEIKLIWNDLHRVEVMKKNNVSYSQISDYLKADCNMLSFCCHRHRKKAAEALQKMGGTGFVFVDNYRDVILYQAHFKNTGSFPELITETTL